MSKISAFIKSLKEKMKDSILRFPATILCLLIIYVLIDIMRYTYVKPTGKLFLVLSYGVFATFIVDILLENLKQTNIRFRLICYFLTYLVLNLSYFFVSTKIGPNALIFSCLAWLAVAVLYNKERGQFETNLARILVSGLVSVFFSIVLLLGVLSVVFSIDMLLIDISTKVYIEISQIVGVIVFPILFLSGIPKLGEKVGYPAIVKKMLRFIVLPLLIASTVVLYVYYGKLAFTRTFPIEKVIAISISFLSVAISTLILITPFEEKLPKYTRKWGVFLLIPVVLILMFAAICNIRDEGITFLAYLSLTRVITTIIGIILIKLRDGKYQYNIFLVAAVVSLICGIGPINMFKLTTISQQKILTSTLEKNGMLKDGKILPNSGVTENDRKKILRAVGHLKVFGLELPKYYNDEGYMSPEKVFGFKDAPSYTQTFRCETRIIDLSGYKYFVPKVFKEQDIQTDKGLLKIELNYDKGEKWIIYLDDEVLFEKKREDIYNAVYNKVGNLHKEECTQDEMSYVYNSDKINLKVLCNYLEYRDGECIYSDYSLLLNLPDKEVIQ